MDADVKVLIGPSDDEMVLTGPTAQNMAKGHDYETDYRFMREFYGEEALKTIENKVLADLASRPTGEMYNMIVGNMSARLTRCRNRVTQIVQLPSDLSPECREFLERNFKMMSFKPGVNYNGHKNAANVQVAIRHYIYFVLLRLGDITK